MSLWLCENHYKNTLRLSVFARCFIFSPNLFPVFSAPSVVKKIGIRLARGFPPPSPPLKKHRAKPPSRKVFEKNSVSLWLCENHLKILCVLASLRDSLFSLPISFPCSRAFRGKKKKLASSLGKWFYNKTFSVIAGWSSSVARQAHNLKVLGSNPNPAPNFKSP